MIEEQRGFREILVTEPLHPYLEWWPPGHLIGYEHSFVHMMADFVKAVVKGKSASPTFADGLANQRVLAASSKVRETKRGCGLSNSQKHYHPEPSRRRRTPKRPCVVRWAEERIGHGKPFPVNSTKIFRADSNLRASRLEIDRWIPPSTTHIERPFTVIATLLK
jgi:hypothetical protein